MPKFSAFTRFSHLRFSSRKSAAQQIYEDAISNQGGTKNFSGDFYSLNSSRVYANSMAVARARLDIERAGNQFLPSKAVEMLPALEREHGVIPGPNDTIRERQKSVSVAALISRGARKENVESVLSEIAGAYFLQYMPTPLSLMVTPPDHPETYGNWVAPGSAGVTGKLVQAISVNLGSEQHVEYTILAGDIRGGLQEGMTMTVDLGDYMRAETVTLTEVNDVVLHAVFNFPHEPGTPFTTARAPNQPTTKRQNLIVIDPATPQEIIRKMHRALGKLLRETSTWSIAFSSGTGQTGPFKVGDGKIGFTSLMGFSY